MLPKKIIQIVLYGVGLGSLAAVVYFAGPFIAIGGWHPLENCDRSRHCHSSSRRRRRSIAGFSFLRRRKARKQIAEASRRRTDSQ